MQQYNMQNLKEKFEEYTSNQQIVAAAACAMGGALIVLLSLVGWLGGVQSIARSGYSWGAILFYLMIIPLGFAIWRGITFAAWAAAGLIILDFILDIIVSYARFSDFPGWAVALKFILFFLVLQVVWERGDDEEAEEEAPGYYQAPPPQQRMPQQPAPPVVGRPKRQVPGPRR